MSKFAQLLDVTRRDHLLMRSDNTSVAVLPCLGGRVFAEVGGMMMHRINLENARDPCLPYNNIGGNTLWPAPEGGRLGFNYRGDEWYVQECMNRLQLHVAEHDCLSTRLQERISLVNRAGTIVHCLMSRDIRMDSPSATSLPTDIECSFSYVTYDSFQVLNDVPAESGLIAAWSLEQFDASETTLSFCCVAKSANALNIDYYDPPRERVTFLERGITYRTDGQAVGQIGIREQNGASFIGFYDTSRRLLCLRKNLTPPGGVYINIADNEQEYGPYSASDNYSIYNSGPDMNLFELETIGPVDISDGLVRGSKLHTVTTFAVFRNAAQLIEFVRQILH